MVAAKAELVSITLFDVSARLEAEPGSSVETVTPVTEHQSAYVRDGDSLRYRVSYSVTLTREGLQAAAISCAYDARYTVPADFVAEDDEYEAYGLTTVTFALYPFVRELVHSMSARLSLPPVTLEVLRLPMVLPSIDRARLRELEREREEADPAPSRDTSNT